MASFARRAPLAPPAGARRARARAPPGRPLFCRRRRRRAPPCACGSQRDGRAGRADDAAAPSPAPAGAAAPGAARWGDARPSGRRLLGGAATALAVALGGNFLESTSALLGLAPQNARSSRLDVLYPVSGYLRCYRPDIGVEFIYPRDWAADQTLAQRAQRRAELTRGLDPPSAAAARQAARAAAEPQVAYGPIGSTGEENVSVLATRAPPGFTSVRQLVAADNSTQPPARREAEFLLSKTIAPEGSGKEAVLLDAFEQVDAAGRPYFVVEYTVKRPGVFFRHNYAVFCVANGRLYTLNAQVAEPEWDAQAEKLKTAARSFRVLGVPPTL